MSETLLDRLATEIEEFFEPLASAAENPFWFERLVNQLGIETDDPDAGTILSALKSLLDLKDEITALAANPETSFGGIAHLLKSAKDAVNAIRSLSDPG